MSADQRPPFDADELKELFDLSHFDLNAFIRGVQLTLVGGAWIPTYLLAYISVSCTRRSWPALTLGHSPPGAAEPGDCHLSVP